MDSLTRQIISLRGPRNLLDPGKPWHWLSEQEFSRHGRLEAVSTVFLTNRECPFHCLMCDLWQNTLTETVSPGLIPQQIDFALQRLPHAPHLKLYNSGNFFDPAAVPVRDLPAIAARVRQFDTVIVENHPRLCTERCDQFQQLCGTQLEVAMGLETAHEPTLARLNKQMTLADFESACRLLQKQHILIRSFVLLKLPWSTEQEGIEHALQSVRFAFDCGVSCCSVIPVRAGNGMLDQLQQAAQFEPPKLSSLEIVLKETLSWRRGRVFADLWDARRFADSPDTAEQQLQNLLSMNLRQQPL
jgi:radical SAM enzyme (TIGR01210 family)